ncbi:long-chain-fatty-acid--CoA ligase [Bacillus thermotolerans]|uniref:long-chain-fatty-acid--CoA ligase n=1 Tax=Bacillus thermotolerans TaxID=1221996 RepID=UPI00057D6634|nr:long-chain-fatty-acid--CoA ligase [Bacillus thermotolerans]KKB34823.1 Long-chain-fatty-acid--CoA ligase [Bacillus thermotolerans]KKB37188.1 Long-chain-fatty-acid--CoA ligase [Bacillus thermotolerans]
MSVRPWLSCYPKEIPTHLSYDEQPLHSYLTHAAELYGEKTAIHFMGKDLSFQEVYESALKIGRYLRKLGIEKGDRVAIMLPNSPQAVISYFGTLYAGGIVVQTNPLYTEREIEYQMKDSGAKAIITLDILYPRVRSVMKNTDLQHIIVTAVKDYLPFPKNIIYPFIQQKQTGLKVHVEEHGTNHDFLTIMKTEAPEAVDVTVHSEEDLALLQYTGGTTGFPKGVMLTHKNLIANTSMCAAWMYKCKKGEEIILGVLPFFHVYGMTAVMVLSIMQGYKMVLLPKFDVKMTLKAIQKQRPTLFPGAPTIYIALLNEPSLQKYDLSSIQCCISGSAPLPAEIQQRFEKVTGGRLVEGYGLSETSPVTHSNFLWGEERVKGSVGVPWPDTDAVILSLETGKALPPGEVGEIAIKGPQVMKGYWNRPEETERTFKDGWLLTGDVGYMDENGYFFVVDRKKDVILAGGYNIYPREVEEVLYEHEAVQEAAVIGVPDPYRGETVKAFIVRKEGHIVTEEELDQYMRENLAVYKVPKIYEFRDELPKTAVGKILRRVLVDEEKKNIEKTS